MSNGSEACCALAICCAPLSAQRRDALVKIFSDAGLAPTDASVAADVMLTKFALAPKEFEGVIHGIATMARQHPTHE